MTPTNDCRHRFLLRDWHINEPAISKRVQGNWLLRCGHCGTALGGCRGDVGVNTEVMWRHNDRSWFGAFYVLGDPGLIP